MRRVFSYAALSLMVIAATAGAQRSTRGTTVTSANPSPELGVDGGLQFTMDDPKTTAFQIPIQGLRMGFYVSPAISIEPSLRFNHASVSGGGSATDYGLGVGLLYHFSTSRMANQMYVRPFIGLDGISGGGNSDSAFSWGAGFGVKVPVGSRFASRWEANLSSASNNGVSRTAIGLLAGLSVYTH